MENSSSAKSLIIIELISKLIQLGFEYITKVNLRKAKSIGTQTISLAVWLLVLWLFTAASWVCLMGLLFVYLQTLNLTLINIWLILSAVNFGLLGIVFIRFYQVKRKLTDF